MLKEKTILITDDDERNIFALAAALKHKGATILSANNGFECLEILRSGKKIDIVLLDMMMQKLDGYETLKEIRSDYTLKNTAVIALTAQAMIGDENKCMEAGADAYCSKPVDLYYLINKIELLLK